MCFVENYCGQNRAWADSISIKRKYKHFRRFHILTSCPKKNILTSFLFNKMGFFLWQSCSWHLVELFYSWRAQMRVSSSFLCVFVHVIRMPTFDQLSLIFLLVLNLLEKWAPIECAYMCIQYICTDYSNSEHGMMHDNMPVDGDRLIALFWLLARPISFQAQFVWRPALAWWIIGHHWKHHVFYTPR
jgi:hypothetical protein